MCSSTLGHVDIDPEHVISGVLLKGQSNSPLVTLEIRMFVYADHEGENALFVLK